MVSKRPIRALLRGLEALTVLNPRDGATVSEVAQEIRLPRTTVYRVLETLCESGFVYRDAADERYRLTVLVGALSAGFEDDAWVTRIGKPCLFELGDSIVWPVYIATLTEGRLIVREVTDHRSPLAIEPFSAGMELPLMTSSAGRLYLAHCAETERAALLGQSVLAFDPEELSRRLAEVRKRGYADTSSMRRLVDEGSISVPVHLAPGALATLTVRFATAAVPLNTAIERFLPKLRHCAVKIGTAFSQAKTDSRKGMPRTAA